MSTVWARATSGRANTASSTSADRRSRSSGGSSARTRRIRRRSAAFASASRAPRVKGFRPIADTVRWMGRQSGEVTTVPAIHR